MVISILKKKCFPFQFSRYVDKRENNSDVKLFLFLMINLAAIGHEASISKITVFQEIGKNVVFIKWTLY